MERIESLDKLSFDHLFPAFSEAFGSYEVQINKDELRAMLKRRGYSPEFSFGAFENNKLVSFTLNGIGQFNARKTAYDTGTGTLEAFRGKGMASKIFTDSIPYLKNAGVSQYLLEVLQHNTNAVSVYKKLGFTVSREFNYFVQPTAEVQLLDKKLSDIFNIQETSLENAEGATEFWDFVPSWQNSFEAIKRSLSDFKIIGSYHDHRLVGYCIFEPTSGDISQIAVSKDYRRQGIGTALLSEMLKINKHSSIKAINTEIACESITHFFESNHILLRGKQFEMIKSL
ncbi:GNAT family N-acetyltransferase [Ancylomarina salipaludis]|uniref:GNAT family N-acetyltransferase n=1 Tax=Ancylomarina salipaludis TaxID=2501299 RepID=A0A4Q1JJS6_9BACT|nr:GNAT family N-acetyltransferase [Ancylomarina salipaludis]RXQ91533.1 GNAT family N-acetyltransferase [Ancylomarina salipaludis]